MPYDFKKEQKELYQPKTAPALVHVPKMNYLAVRGKGDPNDPDGEYARSIPLLYGVAYTLKMSPKAGHVIDGFFDYTVPPLEGFWWQPGLAGVDYANKAGFHFLSLLRLPDFVTRADFDWAVQAAAQKKKMDLSPVEFFPYDEGLCVQCLHLGPYDAEPQTAAKMHDFMRRQGYALDITDTRYHHEIYLSDPRKCDPARLKTVLRHPVRPAGGWPGGCSGPSRFART